MESLFGSKGENSIKISDPTWAELERRAGQVEGAHHQVPGSKPIGVSFCIQGQTNIAFRSIAPKCARWGIRVADIDNVVFDSLSRQ